MPQADFAVGFLIRMRWRKHCDRGMMRDAFAGAS
jgi:hypothetical protein